MELNNRIYQGDAVDLIKQMPDKCVDLIVTDPPYLISNTDSGEKSSLSKRVQQMYNELLDNNLTISIDENILDDLIRVMKKINIYIWCNGGQIPMYLDYFVQKKKCKFDIIIWNKTNATPLFNCKYMTDKEYCLYFHKNAYLNPISYESAKTVYYQPINIKDKKKYGHPTIKPMNIISNLIANSSREGDLVFDPFLGSGTTAVASKKLNRKYLGFEISEKFFKIAEQRIEDNVPDNSRGDKQLKLF